MHAIKQALAAVLAGTALSGCGGGGGGGGGSTAPTPPPGGDPGITLDNAFDAAGMSLAGAETVLIDGFDASSAVLGIYLSGTGTIRFDCSAGGQIEARHMDTGDRVVGAGDRVSLSFLDCGSLNGTVSFEIAGFVHDDAILAFSGRLESNLAFASGTVLAGEQHFAYSNSGSEERWRSSDARMTVSNEPGSVIRFADLNVDLRRGIDENRISLSGAVSSSWFSGVFETTAPILSRSGRYPDSGSFEVSARGSSLRITPHRFLPMSILEVDSSGSGSFVDLGIYGWGEFPINAFFDVDPSNKVTRIVQVAMSPSVPMTGDPLTVAVSVLDLDMEPIDINYEWYRNGVAMPAITSDTYPPNLHAEGDTIRVHVFADDGITWDEGVAQAVIQPPAFRITSPQPTLETSHGEMLAFQVSVGNLNGNPLPAAPPGRFALQHGPTGMTVDADTGWVNWTPIGPLFDRETEFHWAIGSADPSIAAVTGSVIVRDPTRRYPLHRTGFMAPGSHAGLAVGDFDGDGNEELLVADGTALSELRWNGAEFVQSWMYPFALPQVESGAVATADIDGDGRHEFFVCGHANVFVLDGIDRRVRAQADVGCRAIIITDLTADGLLELVALPIHSGVGLTVLRPDTLEIIWASSPGDFLGLSLAVGNVDTDPALELVTASGLVVDGATFSMEWSYAPGFGEHIAVGDLTGDGIAEIVAIRPGMNQVLVLGGISRSILLEHALQTPEQVAVADLGGDTNEILVGAAGNVAVLHLDVMEPALQTIASFAAPWSVTALAVGDTDGDTQREVIAFSGVGRDAVLRTADPSTGLTIEHTSPYLPFGGPFAGGQVVRSNSAPPLLAFAATSDRSTAGATLLTLSADTESMRVGAAVGGQVPNSTTTPKITVLDYDLDGIDEVFIGTTSVENPIPPYATRAYVAAIDAFSDAIEWDYPLPTGLSLRSLMSSGPTAGAGANLVMVPSMSTDYRSIGLGLAILNYDLFNGELSWETTEDAIVDAYPANLDGTENEEIVAAIDNRIAVYSAVGSGAFALSNDVTVPYPITSLAVGDSDGDGKAEIYALTILDTVHIFDHGLNSLGIYSIPGAKELYLEPTLAERKNLIVAMEDPEPHIAIVDARSGSTITRSPPLRGQVTRGSLQYVDPSDGGNLALSFATQRGIYVTR